MDVTVVICTYNRAERLQGTLDALREQRVPEGLAWDLLVVDNNSSDDTKHVVERFARAAPMPVTYAFEGQQGQSFARNTGVARATGEVLAFTDDDILPSADWAALCHSIMQDAKVDVLGGRILPRWLAPVPAWLEGDTWLQSHLALMTHERAQEITVATGTPQIWGANMVVRRGVFDRVGLFDTNRGHKGTRLAGGEDVDFIRRALAEGVPVLYDPRLVVWHRIPPERLRRGYFLRWHFDKGEAETRLGPAPTGRALFGAPLFRYRFAMVAFAEWIGAAVRRGPAMHRAVDLAHAVGCVWGSWRRHA